MLRYRYRYRYNFWYNLLCHETAPGGGITQIPKEMLILLMWLGGVGGQRQNAYVKDLNPYSPEKGL